MKPNQRQGPRIVVVGGGVAGLILVTRLGHALGRRGLARISLIDRSWVHVWKPMLHTFAVWMADGINTLVQPDIRIS